MSAYNKHMLTKRPLLYISLAVALVTTLICPFSAHSEDFYPAKVKDISDRAYESAVIELLDNATESIVISMYIMTPAEKGPISFLLNDLLEALDREVSVTIYLNTKFSMRLGAPTFDEKPFQVLLEKGAMILPVSSKYMLHDKLIIVDHRYVVEGSTNWSTTAMKVNFESSTLIDSPGLAREKLDRLAMLPYEKDRKAKIEELKAFKEASREPNKEPVILNSSLLENKNFFPRMLTDHDDKAMDAYILLAAKSQVLPSETSGGAFPVFLDFLADELKIPKGWLRQSKRDEVAKVLRRLQDKYNLISVKFQYGKEAWVTLKELPGDAFSVSSTFSGADYLSSTLARTEYVYLIKALLSSRGSSIDSYTREELSKRFHIGLKGLRKGIRELEGEGDGKGEGSLD